MGKYSIHLYICPPASWQALRPHWLALGPHWQALRPHWQTLRPHLQALRSLWQALRTLGQGPEVPLTDFKALRLLGQAL